MEAFTHEQSIFVTLTYSEQACPLTDLGVRTLSENDLAGFLKRYRYFVASKCGSESVKIRYFACGEYGERGTVRPHYHLVIFGRDMFDLPLIQAAWSKKKQLMGHVSVSSLNRARSQYVAKYTTKKLVSSGPYVLADSRLDEFSSRSRGLGSAFIDLIADASIKGNLVLSDVLSIDADVPGNRLFDAYILKLGGVSFPVDQFVRRKLLSKLGGRGVGELTSARITQDKSSIKDIDEEQVIRLLSDCRAYNKFARAKWIKDRRGI